MWALWTVGRAQRPSRATSAQPQNQRQFSATGDKHNITKSQAGGAESDPALACDKEAVSASFGARRPST